MIFSLGTAGIFDKNRIEKVLQLVLPYFLILVFITTIAGAFSGYLDHNSWKMGDWLINYQGGLLRRALLGEVIYQLAHLTHINPGLYVVTFQIFFYALFFIFSYKLMRRQHVLLPYIFLIFSPFIFTFQINDLQGGFRKEIIYFALLAFITWSATVKEHKAFENIFYITLLFYPLIILTHEMLAIFLPYLLVVYLSVVTLTKKKFFIISLLLLPSVFSFLVAIHYVGTSTHVAEIFSSIARENYTLAGGAISWLDKDLSYGIAGVKQKIDDQHYVYYIFIVILALLSYIPIYKKLKLIVTNKLSLLLITISLVGSIGLFVIAVDWGRFIYIHLISIFLLSMISIQQTEEYKINTSNKSVNILVVIFFIAYSLLWHIPHYNSPKKAYAQNYKQINIIAPVKPYKKIFTYITAYKFPISSE